MPKACANITTDRAGRPDVTTDDEGSAAQKTARRDRHARSRAEARAAEGNQARPRVGRPSRERRVPRREGAPDVRAGADLDVAEARRGPADGQPRQAAARSRRLRLDVAP